MKDQIENQIRQSEVTISLCELLLLEETIAESRKDLIRKRIENCLLNIQILERQLNKPKFDEILFNICNPSLS